MPLPLQPQRLLPHRLRPRRPPRRRKRRRRQPAPVATGNAVFPSAVDPKYSALSPGKQRFKTCDDQYNANKATKANGGLNWIQKGGGYYSECNKRLKGPA